MLKLYASTKNMLSNEPADKKQNSYGKSFMLLFTLLVVLALPFKRYLLPDTGQLLRPVSEPLVRFSAVHIFHISKPYTDRIISDATGMYIHFFHLVVLAAMLTGLTRFLPLKRPEVWQHRGLVMIRYYLSLQLLIYGLSKVFRGQFYLPEPNTLFTTIGNATPDLLFWSTMGISPVYAVFSGIIEIIPALLLLSRRTSALGAFIATMVMVNVVMINIGFDVSVKLYSIFLLLLCAMLSIPAWQYFHHLLLRRQPALLVSKPQQSPWYTAIKLILTGWIIAEALYPYVSSHNFNDATAKRPLLHGAYVVESFTSNHILRLPLLTDTARWKRIFIHRKGYFIVQYMNDSMQDYEMETDTLAHCIYLQHTIDNKVSVLDYTTNHDRLYLSGKAGNDTLEISVRKIDLNTLPAMQHKIHWTIDE